MLTRSILTYEFSDIDLRIDIFCYNITIYNIKRTLTTMILINVRES